MHTNFLYPLVVVGIGFGAQASASVQVINRYGIDFCVIGDPGNRATNSTETPFNGSRGSVNYTYALSKTEVSIGQWYEFVDAYGKYISPTLAGPTFIGRRGIQEDTSRPSGWGLIPTARNLPAEVGWRYAAMYCNWLTNDRRTDKAAFETGAYDISTFGKVGGVYTDQVTHSASAKFWIPSLDEWIKAAYWDPNRIGQGQGGYWLRPGGRDSFLKPGLPQNGGETSADTGNAEHLLVGSYPSISGPWGLLDVSGSVSEWTEHLDPDGGRSVLGTYAGQSRLLVDSLRWDGAGGDPSFNLFGIRLATSIPSPGSATCVALYMFVGNSRKRR
ncbi:MAG: SUMF1/EgtB/PvdO family nonheme iron enzyme [Planctomycetes bacterium]|nr:SUMF1/EgtB/PvdO family nonheme iron enzyme [Planctomycetota bacterium]